MKVTTSLALAALLAGGATAAAQDPPDPITGAEIRAHIHFLAHDLLEGRAPGSRGGELAAEYIGSQFMAAGLEPVDGSHFQPVPVVGVTVDPEQVRLGFEPVATGDPAAVHPIIAEYRDEAVVWPGDPQPAVDVSGEMVFVGYGVHAPEHQWDDYKGQDVSGRIVLILVGDPPAPPDEPELFDGRALTYYGRWTYKLEEARRRGARGALLVHRTDAAGYGWDVVASSWTGEQFMLNPGDEDGRLPLHGWLSGPFTRRVLETGGHDLDQLMVMAARRDFQPVATGTTVRARLAADVRDVRTRNVVGLLPGSDPERRQEVVVLTSHYDHLGVGSPDATGDSVYNGAYDNASGVALMIEVAEALASLEARPARSILFMATAAEEAGLLGTRHYVTEPLIPLSRTVAALNVDGANLWGETDDVIVPGAELSSLGPLIERVAGESDLMVRPDPAPGSGIFFRSDHFPFAQSGVPVLYIQHGLRYWQRPPDWGEDMMAAYVRERYHQPGDELRPDMVMTGAVQQARLVYDVTREVASGEGRPAWSPESPYRR